MDWLADVESRIKRKQHDIDRIHYWREHCDDEPRQWADFMLKDSEVLL